MWTLKKQDMKNKDYIHIGYRSSDDSMKRITTIPVGFSLMLGDRRYDSALLKESRQVIRLSDKSEIVKDEYGQHWYHRLTQVGDMESFETYEPLPDYIVSSDYENDRIAGMMIYPYIRIDHSRGLLELHENYEGWRDEAAFKKSFLELNRKNIENF